MGELQVARRHFDRAMEICDRDGDDQEALAQFIAATEADSTMADAWLGRAACGDVALPTITALYDNVDWLHRETSRLGVVLSAPLMVGPHVAITVTDAPHVRLAMISALTGAGEYDHAEALSARTPPLDRYDSLQWRQLAVTALYHATQRWPDVLTIAAEELPERAIVMGAVTASIYAMAAQAAVHLGQGRVALDWLDRVDVIGNGQPPSSSRFAPDVLTAAISPGEHPMLVEDLSYVRGMAHRQLGDEETAQKWLSKATLNGVLSGRAKEALAQPLLQLTVADEDTIASRSDRWDAASAKSRQEIDEHEALERRAELLAEGRTLLAKQVGLAEVKRSVQELEDQLEIRAMRMEAGLAVEGQTNHMLLVGPPGTGKTTTANALGMIYAGLGIVRNPKVKEVYRSDFCGEHIGTSGPKTIKLIEENLGGILFMDEFYTLVERHQDGQPDMIGMEAVNQLLIALENHRFDFCFIGAGYEDRVDQFLTVNPGLAGRFNRKIRFETYTPAELVEIVQRLGGPRDSVLDDDARQSFLDAATTVADYRTAKGEHGIDAVGNGRFARNVIERAERLRDSRIVARKRAGEAVSAHDLKVITGADISVAVRADCAEKPEMSALIW